MREDDLSGRAAGDVPGVRSDMRFSLVSRHLPDPQGTAAGRILFATCQGLLELGHEVEVLSWGPEPPAHDLPPWCTWHPLPDEHPLRTHLRALVRPRADVARIGWIPAQEAIAVADDPVSFAAVDGHPFSTVTFHNLATLDSRALNHHTVRDIQDKRCERRAARRAGLALAYSKRIARALGPRATFVPAAYPIPLDALEPSDEPAAALIADWGWPANQTALRLLLDAWPLIRERTRFSRLLLAGRNLHGVGTSEGIEVIGAVGRSVDVLARAALVAFPCADTSGPKIKVLESLACGIPVVTTPAGIEGLGVADGDGTVIVPLTRFAEAVADLLLDPPRRRALGRSGRAAMLATHAPVPAARARVAAYRRAFTSF